MTYQDFPKLKLKFSAVKTTHIEAKSIIDLLGSNLKEREYKLLDETDDSLIFYNNPWRPRWNFERFIPLDGGEVKIITLDNNTTVTFNYYVDVLPYCFFIFPIISTLTDKQYDGTLFFVVAVPILILISIIRAIWEAKKILKQTLLKESECS